MLSQLNARVVASGKDEAQLVAVYGVPYICVRMQLYMCPHAVSQLDARLVASGKDEAQLVASKRAAGAAYRYMLSQLDARFLAGAAYRYMCVLIILYMLYICVVRVLQFVGEWQRRRRNSQGLKLLVYAAFSC
jgi:hypothetical protein